MKKKTESVIRKLQICFLPGSLISVAGGASRHGNLSAQQKKLYSRFLLSEADLRTVYQTHSSVLLSVFICSGMETNNCLTCTFTKQSILVYL